MAIIYLGRNNSATFRLMVDGVAVADDVMTRVMLYMPGAGIDGSNITFDSSTDADIELTENATVVKVSGGLRDMKQGRYRCLLTVFDNASPNGLAWDQVSITVRDWPPEV